MRKLKGFAASRYPAEGACYCWLLLIRAKRFPTRRSPWPHRSREPKKPPPELSKMKHDAHQGLCRPVIVNTDRPHNIERRDPTRHWKVGPDTKVGIGGSRSELFASRWTTSIATSDLSAEIYRQTRPVRHRGARGIRRSGSRRERLCARDGRAVARLRVGCRPVRAARTRRDATVGSRHRRSARATWSGCCLHSCGPPTA